MKNKPLLLLPEEYVKDATNQIENARNRISIVSMVMADDPSTYKLIDELSNAAERGVDVKTAADIFTYGELGGFFLPTKNRSKKSKETNLMSRQFKKSGVKFSWLGKNRLAIAIGRTHMKWCLVDDTVYSFGGVNMYEEGINCNDFIFKINNKQLANNLSDEYDKLIAADHKGLLRKSRSFKLDDKTTVLIDGGIFLDSIIYNRACSLAKISSKITLVSQYCPTGKLGRLLKKTTSSLYFNTPEKANFINRTIIQAGMNLSGNKTLYKNKKYLHAKFIIFELNDGKKIAITGSHNFIYASVMLGTKEIAIETEDKDIIKQLETFLENNVK